MLKLIIIIIIVILTVLICRKIHRPIRFRGGSSHIYDTSKIKVTLPLLKAYRVFRIAQDINVEIIEAESARDFWIADFMFIMANNQFAKGLPNTAENFPLVDNKELVREGLIGLKKYWDDEIDEKLEKTMEIINRKYPEKDIFTELKPYVTITTYSMNLIKKMYPKLPDSSILALLLRYGSMYTYTDGGESNENRNLYISKALLSIPPDLYHFYNRTLPNTIESFASPINHTLDKFCAIFEEDKEFGAVGPFTKELVQKNKGSSFIVNPPYDSFTMKYVSSIINELYFNNYTVCLPSKDGGLFQLYDGRMLHKKEGVDGQIQQMNPAIEELLRIDTLSGILIIPSKLMFYWSYFKQKKQRISYDTIFLYYLPNEKDIIGYIKRVKNIMIKFAFGDKFKGPKRIYDIDREKIMQKFPGNGAKIIKSLEIYY